MEALLLKGMHLCRTLRTWDAVIRERGLAVPASNVDSVDVAEIIRLHNRAAPQTPRRYTGGNSAMSDLTF
jgi:hypothetical protein